MPPADPNELHGVFDSIDAGLIVVDREARVRRWNSWMVAAAGIGADAVIGKRLEEIFPALSKTRLPGAINESLSAGTSSILTHSLNPVMFPLKTGTGRALVHNVTVRGLAGAPPRCLIEITDVTVAAERDRLLRDRQNARYDAVVDNAPDAIVTLDADGVIQFANSAAAREFGYPVSELKGRSLDMLFDNQEGWRAAWESLQAGEAVVRPVELVARRKDGSPSYLEMSAARWNTASPVFITAILRDVNERRATLEALRTLNETLERRVAERTADRDRMWRLSKDVMLVARTDGRINAVNPAWSNLLGWDAARLEGSNLRDFIVPDDRPKLDEALKDLGDKRVPARFEVAVRARGGDTRVIAWSAVAVDGLFQAVGRDVTAERQAEEALRKAEEALRQSQKMEAIGQLSGGIAHDFNNLLTGIIGAMDMLKRRIATHRYDDVERFVNAARNSANRAATLTHRLLAFARQQPLAHKPTDINRLVTEMDDLLRQSVGEQVEVVLKLAPDAWPVLTDGNQLENAILNLAINSRDAMPEGGRLTIETSNLTVDEPDRGDEGITDPGEFVALSVGDTGAGMSREVAERAFNPFFTTKPIGQGTGLGLSMVYGFIKQSQGHIHIDSEVGRGTTVTLYLPRHQGELARDEERRAAEIPRGTGETVLLVEDDPSVRLLIAEVLRELGYTCLEAKDGEAAMPVLVSKIRLDLMITDVGLPGLNGSQLAEIARQHRPDLKVLFVSGYAERSTIRSNLLGPGMDLVTKPFRLDALAVRIREMITSAHATVRGESAAP